MRTARPGISGRAESWKRLAETLEAMLDYTLPLGVWVTVGVYLWTDYQDIAVDLRRSGMLQAEDCSPGQCICHPR